MLSQGEQLTLYDPDPDTWFGKMSPALLVRKRAKISARSLKKPSELRTADFQYLDLRAGYGNMLGPYWELNSHFRDPSVMLAASRLMYQLSRLMHNKRLSSSGAGVGYGADSKVRRKIREKKIALGHAEDEHEPEHAPGQTY